MLYPVKDCPKGRSKWCGPTALSALTGIGFMDSIAVLKFVRMTRGAVNPIIKGVTTSTMCEALAKLGYICVPVKIRKGENGAETFAAFLRRREGHLMKSPLLITVTGHYLAACGRKAIDSKTPGGEPVFISQIGSRRARMTHAWEVRASPFRTAAQHRALKERIVAEAHQKVADAANGLTSRVDPSDIAALEEEARLAGLRLTIYSSKTGCIIRPPGDRPFHFGPTSVYRGAGWLDFAIEFCRDFDEDDHLDWNWERQDYMGLTEVD